MSKRDEVKAPALLPIGPVLLVTVSVALCLLALFQWMELLVVLEGGSPSCAISSTLNCTDVWQSAFASRIHNALGMPIAGLGLVYGLTCLGLSLVLVYRALKGELLSPLIAALRLTAVLGVLSCITLFVATVRIGALCPTCLATYALTIAFAVVAARLLPGKLGFPEADMKPAVLWAGGFAVLSYLVLLYPGIRTAEVKNKPLPKITEQQPAPQQKPEEAQQQGKWPEQTDTPLGQFIAGMAPMEQRALGEELQAFRNATVPPGANQFPVRFRKGADSAPIHLTDFTDIKCGHCRVLEETLKAVEAAVPPGSFTVEPRYFPLDGECNKEVKQSPGDGVRCAAARAEVCLEGTDFFWTARSHMFDEQDTLTKERVLEIASKGPLNRQKLEACMASPETQKKIDDDVKLALLYGIEGTPLVLVNGRQGSPMGPFLYALVATGGNMQAPELQPLLNMGR